MRRLTVSEAPKTAPQFLLRLFRDILPLARQEIQHWTELAMRIPDDDLRTQALASLTAKRFHADGGCVYAAVMPQRQSELVRLIVALQTISDYLDNLCDRCDRYDPADFHQLHHAMRDAVTPGAPLRDYYALRDHPEDGGYLSALVCRCQQETAGLVGYQTVQPYVSWLVARYCELQEYKHIDPDLREPHLLQWWQTYAQQFPELEWWEFAAATGSTLGVFALFLAATSELSSQDAAAIYKGYFPWVGGLHILLDYLIDLEEDQLAGDFNFVRCYATPEQARLGIRRFARESWLASQSFADHDQIHRFVVKGLLGMYLSDTKAGRQKAVRPTRRLLWEFGWTAWMFYGACVVYRAVR